MKEDLAMSKNNYIMLQEENEQLKNERNSITQEHTKQLEVRLPGLLHLQVD